MYEAFYGLKEKPFTLLPDPDYLYLSPKHQRALTLLEYGMMNHAGFCVICGDTGAGKTTLLRQLLTELGDDTRVGLITNTHQSFGELLNWVLMAFGLEGEGCSRTQMHRIFVDYLIEQYAQKKHTVLIVDEAQNMPAETLEELRMLSNINADKDQVLQIILAGQPKLRETLRRPELMQFAQRISVDYYLEALNVVETQAYIYHRLHIAGSENAIFTDEACQAIFKYSNGTPRLINLLCDTALVYGFAEQIKIINAQLIHDVVEEQHSNSIVPTFNTELPHAVDSLPPVNRVLKQKNESLNASVDERLAESVAASHASLNEKTLQAEDAISRLTERAVDAIRHAESEMTNIAAVNQTEEQLDNDECNVEVKDNIADPATKEQSHYIHTEEAETDIGFELSGSTADETHDEMPQQHTRRGHSRSDDVYPIVHIEEPARKGLSLVLVGLMGGMFIASIGMLVFAWYLVQSGNLGMSVDMANQKTEERSVDDAKVREMEVLQKERDAALAVSRALERERDAAISSVKAQEEMRAAERRATEILAEQERKADLRLREAKARARAAERAEQKAVERERVLKLKAQQRLEELEAQRLEAIRLEAIRLEEMRSQMAASEALKLRRPDPQPYNAQENQLDAEFVSSLPEPASGSYTAVPDSDFRVPSITQKEKTIKKSETFTANPCNSPSAKFLSTCKK